MIEKERSKREISDLPQAKISFDSRALDCLDEAILPGSTVIPQDCHSDVSPFLTKTLTKYEDIVLPLDDRNSSR